LNLFPYTQTETTTIQSIPWNITQVNAPSFWTKTKGNGIVVAVVDTGLDILHSEFTGRIINPRNFTATGGISVADQSGHGTHVAGIIGGKNVGVAPECRIMPLKVFPSTTGYEFQDAFRYILEYNQTAKEDDKVKVINCSWGSSACDTILSYLIRRLIDSGVIVVVSAGNAGDGKADTSEIWNYPGYLWEVITSAAINQDNTIATYSSSYDGIDLASPGTEIYSSWPGGGYKLLSGTSMSAPHITGAVALIYAAWKIREGSYPTAEQVEDVLFKHVKKVDLAEELVGYGLLDLTWDNRRWPLYRVQVDAYYYKSGQDETFMKVKNAGFNAYKIKY
jgi:major intracellular serine protease